MSNAPKVQGFFQTIPGLITATAGLLSAATGAIVALNQTGVIELKKPNPAATQQVAPAPPATQVVESALAVKEPTEAAAQPGQKPTPLIDSPSEVTTSQPSPKAAQPLEQLAIAGKEPGEEQKPAPGTATQPSPAPPVPLQPPQAPPPSNLPPRSANEVDAERLKAIQEGATAVVEKPAKVEVQRPVVSAAQPSVSPNPTTTPAVQEQKPAAVTETMPTRSAEVPSSPTTGSLPPSRGPVATTPTEPRPSSPGDRPERLADGRPRPDAHEPVVDGSGARVVRPPTDIVRAPESRGGGKRIGDPSDRPPRGSQAVRVPAGSGGRQLDLTGLILAIPSGWMEERVEPGPMAPAAAMRIPDPEGDGIVLVSRYMGAKGPELEERAIDRWLGMVSLPNGSRPSRSLARVEKIQLGAIRITTVDIAGTVKRSPRDAAEPDHRVMGAIIDHPAGPHLVTITGPARAMSKWEAAIDGFLRSARVE